MRSLRAVLPVALCLVVACGDVSLGEPVGGTGGTCQPLDTCSIPDAACASGFRYPDDATHDQAGECVPETPGTGGNGNSETSNGSPDDGVDDGPDSGDATEGGPGDGSDDGPDASGGSSTDAGSSDSDGDTGAPGDSSLVLYLNFEGVTLTQGPDDATNDQTEISQLAQQLQPFGGGDQPDEVRAIVAGVWSEFGVTVTDQRPASGDYTMVVITPTNPFGGTLAISSQDCDNDNPNNVAAVFASAASGHSSALIAAAITRGVGFSLGLERVDGEADFMHNNTVAESPQFVDACLPHVMAAQCAAQHVEHCPGGGQNSYAEVSALTSK